MSAIPHTEEKQQEEHRSFVQKTIELIEAAGNMFFYLFVVLIVVLPPLKWLGDLFTTTTSKWMVPVAAIVFAIILPAIAPFVTEWITSLAERIRKGELLGIIFRPLRAVCAVITVYGILALEYKTIHGDSGMSLLEVYAELFRAL